MLLQISNLTVKVASLQSQKTIVDKVSFSLSSERVLALVGGSGSGKTTIGLAILRLLAPQLTVTFGAIDFNGENILSASPKRMRQLRGKEVAMIFQEPLDAFNPVLPIGFQIEEMLWYHTALPAEKRKGRVYELLNTVGIRDPRRVARDYPHQLSGGMRQRAMIAQALAANPKLIIADEPTSNLDVTLQARVIELIKKLIADLKLSVLLITHDLGVVDHLADEVVVLSEGSVVEQGAVRDIVHNPQQDYTRKLMEALA
ncbi:MAG: ABC transporter ATP-binding protein [Candidatus Omnitrophica bacterium]|nr:ABC transporter ATP-binding protein [Candidatus Omnitrophota bacterium]